MIHALEPPTAERVIREADARHDRALELLGAAPALRRDPWVALTLGDASGVRDARHPGGPLGQPPLFYVARSRDRRRHRDTGTRAAGARRRPERAGRRGVDESLDRVLAG